MVFISEWLPNPKGSDVTGEFVELYNSGPTAMSVGGWTLMVSAKKRAKILGTVPANGYLVLYRKQTKLVLKNSDEAIALYDASGRWVDESSFIGTATEGKSFNRKNFKENMGRFEFSWGDATPGSANRVASTFITKDCGAPFNVPINKPNMGGESFVLALLGIAVLLAGMIIYTIKTNEDLSNIFFPRNKTIG